MDYAGILQDMRDVLEQKRKSYTAAVDRTSALAAELDRARAADAALGREVERTKASIRGLELMAQQVTDEPEEEEKVADE